MAQNAPEGVSSRFLEKAVEGIDNPYILALLVVACVLAWQLPAIIKACAESIRLGRENKVETEGRRNILASQLKALEDKRLRHKRRDRQ